MAARIQWLVYSDDPKEIKRLLRRVSAVGGLRKMGYGAVREWQVDAADGEWQSTLVRDYHAARRLPLSIAMAKNTAALAVMPPYWHSSMIVEAVGTGARCELLEGVCEIR